MHFVIRSEDQYYSQTNNALDPQISCQCTAAVEGLDIMHYNLSLIPGPYDQPEDRLRWSMSNISEIVRFSSRSHPKSTIPAAEWLDVLEFAVNIIYPNSVYYSMKITPALIEDELLQYRPVVLSTKLYGGHYIVVIGIKDDKYIIDDPYNKVQNKYQFKEFRGRLSDLSESKGYGLLFNPYCADCKVQ